MGSTLTKEDYERYGIQPIDLDFIWAQLDQFKKEGSMTPDQVHQERINELRRFDEVVDHSPNKNQIVDSNREQNNMTRDEAGNNEADCAEAGAEQVEPSLHEPKDELVEFDMESRMKEIDPGNEEYEDYTQQW